jgi:DNA polymerase-3 subunit delta'
MPFSRVVGHSQQISFIKKLIESSSFPQVSIFSGPGGIGKKLIAVETAKLLTGRETAINIKVIGKEEIPKIEEIRESIEWMFRKPVSSNCKVLIVDRAESLRKEVSNALLKLLEEPPSYGYIMLITSNEHSLLPTIRSRASYFRFSKLTEKNVEYILETLNMEIDRRILKISGGSPGNAIAIMKSDILPLIDELINLLKSPKAKEKIVEFSAKFSKASQEETILFLNSFETLLSKKNTIFKWFEIIDTARKFLTFNVKPRPVIEWMLISALFNFPEKSSLSQI